VLMAAAGSGAVISSAAAAATTAPPAPPARRRALVRPGLVRLPPPPSRIRDPLKPRNAETILIVFVPRVSWRVRRALTKSQNNRECFDYHPRSQSKARPGRKIRSP
jgi:hypothetical protein